MQHEKDGHCYTHGNKCIKGQNSKKHSNPGSKNNKEATRKDAKHGLSKKRTGHALTAKKKVFGSLMGMVDSSSGTMLNVTLLSALK